ncbi:hypothetical protein POM88_023226 [Heracleum sosnowskyi]|uniref:Uncharacterized protein n=1 Tax=Heracleum sosnowskyi TaxID=360622 RepID=A0AAD8IH82_9APIA|nr:hypothetical protein POM88_023226 [Heracleum sosnowskyi]
MQDNPHSIGIAHNLHSIGIAHNPLLPNENFTRDTHPYAWRLKKMTLPSSSSTRHPIVTRALSREKALEELQRPHPKRSARPPSQASPSLSDEVQIKVPGDASSRSLWETDEDESLAIKDLEDVSRLVDLCNYDYIPELSDGEAYNPRSQPMLEGVMYLKRRNKTREGATLCCKDLPTSLKKDTLAKAVEQYQVKDALPRPELKGEDKENADNILKLPAKKRNIQILLTEENLIRCGFLRQGAKIAREKSVAKHRMASKKPSKIPFMKKDKTTSASLNRSRDQAHHSSLVKGSATRSTMVIPPSTQITLTEYLRNPSSIHQSGRKRPSEITSPLEEPPPKKNKEDKNLPIIPPTGLVRKTYGDLAYAHVSEAEMYAWSQQSMEESNASMTRCIAELFLHQTNHHKEIRALASSNHKMRKEIETLKSTLAQTQSDAEGSEDTWKKKFEDATEKLKKELQEEKSAKEKLKLDHTVDKEKSDSQFLQKVDDFDWYRLGEETGKYVDNLQKEMDEGAAQEAP